MLEFKILYHLRGFILTITLSFLILINVFIVQCNAEISALTKKKFSPYPEVWGYDLSRIINNEYEIHAVYRMDDGEILFVIRTGNIVPNIAKGYDESINAKCTILNFFSGKKTEIDGYECSKKIDAKEFGTSISVFDMESPIKFSDGSILKLHRDYGGKLCSHMDFWRKALMKIYKDGTKKKYSILASYSNDFVNIIPDQAMCELSDHALPFLYQKLHFAGYHLIDLGDDTFITYGSHLILRFDKDLNTKFIAQSPLKINGYYIKRDFFVLDFEEIEKIAKNLSKDLPFYQGLHDNLLIYLHDKYEAK